MAHLASAAATRWPGGARVENDELSLRCGPRNSSVASPRRPHDRNRDGVVERQRRAEVERGSAPEIDACPGPGVLARNFLAQALWDGVGSERVLATAMPLLVLDSAY